MNSEERLLAAIETETTIRAIARKAGVSNNMVIARLKKLGKLPMRPVIHIQAS